MEPEKKEINAQQWAAIIGSIAALISAATGIVVALYSINKPTSVPSPNPTVQTEKIIIIPKIAPSVVPSPSPIQSLFPSPTVTETPSPTVTPTPTPSASPKAIVIPVEPPSLPPLEQPSPSPSS